MLLHSSVPTGAVCSTHCEHVHELIDLADWFSARGAASSNDEEGACPGRVLQRGINHIKEVGEGRTPRTLSGGGVGVEGSTLISVVHKLM